jgi:hypothetical protein
VILAVLAVALFSGTFAGYEAVLVALTLGYADVAGRALSADAVEAPGLTFRPGPAVVAHEPALGGGEPSAVVANRPPS